MRDPVKVAAEMSARREKILEAAYELFSEKAIEAVSMNEVATVSEIGIATLYRYYGTKQKLALAVNEVQWKRLYEVVEKTYSLDTPPSISAKEWLNFIMETILNIYQEEKKLLRFVYHLDGYMRHKTLSDEMREQYYELMKPITDWYMWMREKAEADHTIRTDLGVSEFLHSIISPVFSAASKYALDVIWTDNRDFDDLSCLKNLKEALMNYACIGAEGAE